MITIYQLRKAAEYAETFPDRDIQINLTAEGMVVSDRNPHHQWKHGQSWHELSSTRQLNPIIYMIDHVVQSLNELTRRHA